MDGMLQESPGSAPPASAPPTPEKNLYILTVSVAAATWLAPWLLLGRGEAWDHWTHFMVSIPIMILAQFATALLLGGFGSLFPLGIIA